MNNTYTVTRVYNKEEFIKMKLINNHFCPIENSMTDRNFYIARQVMEHYNKRIIERLG